MSQAPTVVLFEPDLLFSSRIKAQAIRMGVEVTILTEFTELLRQFRDSAPKGLIMNLDELEGRFAQLGDLLAQKSCISVGYYSHVNTHLAEEAKRFGVRLIISRGAFNSKLKEILVQVSLG